MMTGIGTPFSIFWVCALNALQNSMNRKVGFVLMVYNFGDQPGRCNYISNGADRKDVVVLMREMIARFEGQPEMKGRA